MAVEAEALEREALGLGGPAHATEPVRLKLHAGGDRQPAQRRHGGGVGRIVTRPTTWLAVAAMLAIASVVMWLAPAPTAQSVPVAPGARLAQNSAGAKTTTTNPAASRTAPRSTVMQTVPAVATTGVRPAPVQAANARQCVVLAIVQSTDGACRCVNLAPHQWADLQGHSEDQHRAELLAVPVRTACSLSGHRLVLVAIEGPADCLPRTDAQAERIAECLAEAPKLCDGSSNCYESLARRCLSPEVSVLAQAVPALN